MLEKSSVQKIFSTPFFKDLSSFSAYLPKKTEDFEQIQSRVFELSKKSLQAIYAIEEGQKSFENTLQAFDNTQALFGFFSSLLSVCINTSTEKQLREKALEAKKAFSQFAIEHFSNNKTFYKHFLSYLAHNKDREHLDEQQLYYLQDLEKSFKKAGFHLDMSTFEKVCQLKKQLSALSQEFSKNIADDNSHIFLSREQLQGASDDFLNQLKQEEKGYRVGTDYPTYFYLMENLEKEDSRKMLYLCFQRRAYPQNESLIKQVIEKRQQLATLLGYDNYAQLDIDGEMAQSPEKVHHFIDQLLPMVQEKARQEFEDLKAKKTQGITLNEQGLFKPWDLAYLSNQVKKQDYEVDEEKLSEYFPLENTLEGFFDIYKQFFGFSFKEIQAQLWHNDVKAIEVKDSSQKLLGYVLLDLFPREGKYSHACSMAVCPPLFIQESWQPSVNVVLANFTKASNTKPSLLKFNEVLTFFHEMGHALHALCGKAKMPSLAGYYTKLDFVELPSQILEEWLWQESILKKLPRHYQSQEPLPQKLIDNKLATKRFDTGRHILRQLILTEVSLSLFEKGDPNEVGKTFKKLSESYNPQVYFEAQVAFECAFNHLIGYGAKYYCYLWSKVYALDIFSCICEKQGLLNLEEGERYYQAILSKGGGKDPNDLIFSYLKRKPSQKAFVRDLGLFV